MGRILATILVIGAMGCSDGAAPVIENLAIDQANIVVGVETSVSFAVDFYDPDGDVVQAQVEVIRQEDGLVLLSGTQAIDGAAGLESGRYTGSVTLLPQEAGFFYFRVSVVDEASNQSNALSESIEVVEDTST